MTLIEESGVKLLDYTKTLPAYEREKVCKAFQEINSLYQDQKTKHAEIHITFVDPIRPKDSKLKKGKCCGLSLLKALEEEEAEKQRQQRANSIEQARLERHNALFQLHKNTNNSDPFFQNPDLPSQQNQSFSHGNYQMNHSLTTTRQSMSQKIAVMMTMFQYLGTKAKSQSPVVLSSFKEILVKAIQMD